MNNLQDFLMKAAVNPEYRFEFYRELINSELFVIGSASNVENGIAQTGSRMSIPHFDNGKFKYMAVFTSLENVRLGVPAETSYIQMKTVDFLNLVGPQNIVLNPGLEYGKHFTPGEVRSIIDGTIFTPETYVVKESTDILLGQPAIYPQRLVDVVASVCARIKCVKRAYLVHFYNSTQDSSPHSLISVEMDAGRDENAVAQIGMAIQECSASPDGPVDIYVMGENGGSIEDYCLNQIKPFYKRKWLGLF